MSEHWRMVQAIEADNTVLRAEVVRLKAKVAELEEAKPDPIRDFCRECGQFLPTHEVHCKHYRPPAPESLAALETRAIADLRTFRNSGDWALYVVKSLRAYWLADMDERTKGES